MDDVRTLILDKLSKSGLTLASLSKKVGKNHAYFQQFIERGVPKYLPESVRNLTAELLGLDEAQLRGPPSGIRVEVGAPRNAKIGGSVRIAETIPVYGHARGGKDGQFILNGNKVADILAPPSLSRVPGAYAVYVVGVSMEPRYFAGEAVFVNPGLPVRRGDFVVAQIAASDGEAPYAYVKRFVTLDDRVLKLEQFNPKKPLTFPANKVVSVHRIIMGGDG